jgi:uracil-DNA glycosylase
MELEELIGKIKSCDRCKNIIFNGYVNVSEKPYVKCGVYKTRIPDTIKCLFIAESPPGDVNRFFYNPCTHSRLREKLFEALEIDADGEEGLQEFKRKGYFLIDSIECRVKKTGEGAIPRKVIKNCSDFLLAKVKLAENKGARKIVILGSTALRALIELGSNELRGKSVIKNCGEVVESRIESTEFKIFILPLPARRGEKSKQEAIYVNQCYTKEGYTKKVKDELKRFLEEN